MNDDWLLSLEHTYLQKGSVNILTPLPPEAERKVDFPSLPVTDHHVIDASFIWHTKLGFIAGGWAGDLRETNNGSVYIKLQLINNISFNLWHKAMDGKNNLFGYLFIFSLDSPDLTQVNYCNDK